MHTRELIQVLENYPPDMPVKVLFDSIPWQIAPEHLFISADGVLLIEAGYGNLREGFERGELAARQDEDESKP